MKVKLVRELVKDVDYYFCDAKFKIRVFVNGEKIKNIQKLAEIPRNKDYPELDALFKNAPNPKIKKLYNTYLWEKLDGCVRIDNEDGEQYLGFWAEGKEEVKAKTKLIFENIVKFFEEVKKLHEEQTKKAEEFEKWIFKKYKKTQEV